MIIAKFYPNGEFTQGVNTSKARTSAKTMSPPLPPPPSRATKEGYLQWQKDNADIALHLCTEGNRFSNGKGTYTYLCKDLQGYHYAYECSRYVLEDVIFQYPPGYMIGLGEWTYEFSSLGLSNARIFTPGQNQPGKSRKQLITMTKNMARNIRNGVYLLEQRHGKDNLSFLTLTIPQLCPDNHKSLLANWGKATDAVLKALRKKLLKLGIILEYVYCTEIQGKRYDRTGYCAPHLHIVFNGRRGKKSPWAITPVQIRRIWAKIITRFLPHEEEFETKALENLQRIKYSAARYLSKYMSKGNVTSAASNAVQELSPLCTQWGGMDRQTSKLIKACTVRLGANGTLQEIANMLPVRLEQLFASGLLRYYKRHQIVLGTYPDTCVERVLHVSCGCLSSPTYEGGLVPVIEYLYQLSENDG